VRTRGDHGPDGVGEERPGREVRQRLVFEIPDREFQHGVLAVLCFDEFDRVGAVGPLMTQSSRPTDRHRHPRRNQDQMRPSYERSLCPKRESIAGREARLARIRRSLGRSQRTPTAGQADLATCRGCQSWRSICVDRDPTSARRRQRQVASS